MVIKQPFSAHENPIVPRGLAWGFLFGDIMKRKIHTYTVSGHEFLSDVQTDLPHDQIFREVLGGTEKIVQIGNTCFLKENIAAIIIEDLEEKPCDPCLDSISNPLKLEA